MRRFLIPSVLLLLGAGRAGTSPLPTTDSLELRAVDEGGTLTFRLRNAGLGEISVLPVLDASQAGWRIPRVTAEYRDIEGALVLPPPMGRCGNIDSLQVSHFRRLSTGEELVLNGRWLREAPSTAVEMRLTYATTETEGRDFGDGSRPDAALWDTLPKGSWTSPWSALPIPGDG